MVSDTAYVALQQRILLRVDQQQMVHWMRDPKTGFWVPENRFYQADVAELRAQLLPKKAEE
ncbi:hypothetical protein ACMD2_08307 [Ananas comosus]|uniref:Uncharacterized protein n=1 Tax=Ananas comosus TaxID=4615 RepID=A0A199VH35_ANACO|nr:hypothetical protein ACMD2_08307 [Ananas comosus]